MANETAGGAGLSPGAVRAFRSILFVLLFAAAALTLLGLPELAQAVAAGRWPRAALALPPAILAAFIAGYAAYRFFLVRAGRYPAGKALAQIGLMLLVLGVVGGIVLELAEAHRAGAAATPVELARALRSRDPEVRALAAELARHRPREATLRHVDRLLALLEDPSPEVRRQARATLAALAGRDVGGEGPDAARRWREHWGKEPTRR
jgi:hypothetical protein